MKLEDLQSGENVRIHVYLMDPEKRDLDLLGVATDGRFLYWETSAHDMARVQLEFTNAIHVVPAKAIVGRLTTRIVKDLEPIEEDA